VNSLKIFFWFTDLGFIVYWLITALHLIPAQFLFQDYTNPILTAWNWSFLLLDLMVSASGLAALWAFQQKLELWRSIALISLVLTFSSGLNAIAFWVIRRDFDPTWWIPNLYLILYPLFFLPKLLKLEGKA
jgi:hypothetical protein